MNILFFIQPPFSPNKGGVQQSTAKLSVLFEGMGHKSVILSLSNSEYEKYNGISVFYLEGISSSRHKTVFKHFLEEYKIDLIINQMGSEYHLTKFIIDCKPDGVKVVNTLRMNPLSFVQNIDFTLKDFLEKRGLSFLNNAVLKRIALFYHRHKQKKILNYIISNVDAFVLLNKNFISELNFFGIDTSKYSEKLLAIPNIFPPITDNLSEKENIILFVGRLEVMQKRIDLLQEIWKELHANLSGWEFWVVGDGPHRTNFELFCKRHELNRIRFFGFQDPKPHYQKAKILNFTSANEGFGNVLVEAQQYGVVPVMFNSYSAAPDLVLDGKSGFLVEAFNISKFIKKTTKLANDEELLKSMRKEAISHSKIFEIDAVSVLWFDLLKQLDN